VRKAAWASLCRSAALLRLARQRHVGKRLEARAGPRNVAPPATASASAASTTATAPASLAAVLRAGEAAPTRTSGGRCGRGCGGGRPAPGLLAAPALLRCPAPSAASSTAAANRRTLRLPLLAALLTALLLPPHAPPLVPLRPAGLGRGEVVVVILKASESALILATIQCHAAIASGAAGALGSTGTRRALPARALLDDQPPVCGQAQATGQDGRGPRPSLRGG